MAMVLRKRKTDTNFTNGHEFKIPFVKISVIRVTFSASMEKLATRKTNEEKFAAYLN
jgi:hypothetical protein